MKAAGCFWQDVQKRLQFSYTSWVQVCILRQLLAKQLPGGHSHGEPGRSGEALARHIRFICNPNNLQFYGLYLLIKGYLLLNCRFLEPQVGFRV